VIIKLCSGEHILARRRFFAVVALILFPDDLKKLEGDLDILKMYLHTENEVAMLRHSKLLTEDDMRMANEKIQK